MTIVCLVASFVVLLPEPSSHAGTAPVRPWQLVVNPSNPIRTITRVELERIYRRRSHFWKDGSGILAINLPIGDPLRKEFTEQVLRDDEGELSVFWSREYFHGTAPPAVLQSAAAVRTYVAATINAIGYIPAGDVDASIAVVEVSSED